MPAIEKYEVVVLGTGEAGKYIAWHLASAGKRTAVIERKYIGGSCPNIACLPSKNIIHSAKVASYFGRSEEFGITKESWRLDMGGVRRRKRDMVCGLVEMHLGNFQKSGAEIVRGEGRFIGERTIEVALSEGGTRILRGEQVFLNLGTRAAIDNIPGLVESKPLTHVEALELDRLPDHLVVLGGGYVGLEFAQAMRRFGSRVTILERSARLLGREDRDIAEALQNLLRAEGVEILVNVQLTRVEGTSGDQVRLFLSSDGSETVLEGTHLLVATGRIPNTENIGLELAGIARTERGYIKVNERLETSAPSVWALGDCAGSPHFTHIAFDDFRVVRENLAGGQRITTGRQVPYCLFTDPELARVGLNESEAKQKGIPYRLGKAPMASVLRTRTLSENDGFLKALVASDDKILGFTALGVGAGELLAPVQVAMTAGLSYTVLRDTILTHPTLTEAYVPLFSSLHAT